MKKFLSLTFLAMIIAVASFGLMPITGSTTGCIGGTYTLSDSTGGGTWFSSDVAIATVDGTSGVVTPVSLGTCTITYTLGGSYVTATYYVDGTMPATIGGTTTVCAGSTTTLTDATSGGIWSSSNPSVATVGSATGIVSGVSAGYATIYYTVGSSCSRAIGITVATIGIHAVVGPSSVCVGSTITLTDSFGTGGTWTSSSTGIATISTTGVVTGVALGTTTISYEVSDACGTAYATFVVTVTGTTATGTISGASSVAVGATTTLTDGVGGGAWSSSDATVASIDATSGVVTGNATGTATITYTVVGCGGSAYTTAVIAVTSLNGISGHVLFTSTGHVCYGNVKVWLITYNTSSMDLEAIDSTTVFCGGASSVYYQFTGMSTDSFRIKAAVPDSFSSDYIPTYHNSYFYWHDANVVYHTSGTSDINEDITMAYGTTTGGPGFISGNVMSGADRGTVTTIPAVGMLIYVLNSTSGIMEYTLTDASGNYTLSGLPYGTYTIYPEAINYNTTAYTSITLSSSSSTYSAASFVQHTVSKTIIPMTLAVKNVTTSESSVFAFPNPTHGRLNIQWTESTNENANVTVTDITGRQVYAQSMYLTSGTGATQLDLSSLTSGLYLVSIKSGTVSYNNKIQIQH